MATVGSTTSTSSTNNVKTVAADSTGFSGLTSNDFLKLLVTQLQNQDPTQPVSNEDLLNQLSQMRNLQSNLDLSSTLKSLALSQQLTSSTSFIGKTVTGTDDTKTTVSGVVSNVQVKNGTPYLQVGGKGVQISNVTGVAN